MTVQAIEVRIWDQRVGAVAVDERAGCYAFEYAPAWKRQGIELAPLTMPVSAPESVFLFLRLPNPRSRDFRASSRVPRPMKIGRAHR